MTQFNTTTVFKKKNDILGTDVENITLLLSIENGEYTELNVQASAIWNQIDGQAKVQDIVAALVDTFSVETKVCEAETIAFLSTAVEDGLLEIVVQ